MRRVHTCVKPRLKSNSKRGLLRTLRLSLCLVALLTTLPIFATLVGTAYAADFTINNGMTVGQQNGLLNGETGTILEGGTITTNLDAITGAAATTITVDNAGLVESTAADAIFTPGTLILFNRVTGIIDGSSEGIDANNITNLINDGLIGGNNTAIYIQNNLANLTNSGDILSNDVGIDAGSIGTLENSGTIEAFLGDGVYALFNINSLTNSGNISGGENGVLSESNIIELNNSGTITGLDSGVIAFGNIGTLENTSNIFGFSESGVAAENIGNLTNSKSGSIVGGVEGVFANTSLTKLINAGYIVGGQVGIGAGTIIDVENSGLIQGITNAGIFSFIDIERLTNSGTIIGGGINDGVHADNDILLLNNSGTITGADDGVDANRDIVKLINTGTIIGFDDDGVDADRSIIELVNSGTITGSESGVDSAVDIGSLTNSGTITGGVNGVDALNQIVSLTNSGFINGGSDNGVRGGKNIVSLTNTGSIIGLVYGVSAGDGLVTDGIFSMTNAGVLTGGDQAFFSAGGVDTHLTLNPGSNIYGGLDLGTGTNTLTVGKGLSIDHVFATLPQIINPNGQPLFIDGTRVVVIDSTIFDQQDKVLFDLTQGIFNTVFNHIGDGRNPGGNFANGPAPQFSLGAVAPTETALGNDKSHAWASIFGSHRIIDQDGTIPSRRHNLGGLIIGADGKVTSSMRLGAFFGVAKTDIDTATNNQEIEIDSIFSGLYANLKAENINIDLAVIGGITEQDGTRIVDNNRVNGLQIVKSNIDGTFIAPELAISTQTDIGGTIFQPTLRVGYAGMFLDSTTETGSTAPITIVDRDLHLLHARLELAAIVTSKGADSLNFQFSPYFGIEGRSLIGGEAQDITVLGQSFNFNPGGDEDIGSAFAGFRLSVLQTETFGIFAGLEGSVDTESSTLLTANAGLKWRF